MRTYPIVPPAITATSSATANAGPCAMKRGARACGCEESAARPGRLAARSAPGGLAGGFEAAVLSAVSKVEDEPDDEPHGEPQPVRPSQAVDHRAAHDDA